MDFALTNDAIMTDFFVEEPPTPPLDSSSFTIKSEWFETETSCGIQQMPDLKADDFILESDEEFVMATPPPSLSHFNASSPIDPFNEFPEFNNTVASTPFFPDHGALNVTDFNLDTSFNNNLSNSDFNNNNFNHSFESSGLSDFLAVDIFDNTANNATPSTHQTGDVMSVNSSPTFNSVAVENNNNSGSNSNNFPNSNSSTPQPQHFEPVPETQQLATAATATQATPTQGSQALVLELANVRDVWYRRKNFPEFTIRLRLQDARQEFPIAFEPLAVRLCARRADGVLLTNEETDKLFSKLTVILLLPRVHPTLGKVLEGKVERFKFAQSTRSFGGHINFHAVPTDSSVQSLVRSEACSVSIKSSKPKDLEL